MIQINENIHLCHNKKDFLVCPVCLSLFFLYYIIAPAASLTSIQYTTMGFGCHPFAFYRRAQFLATNFSLFNDKKKTIFSCFLFIFMFREKNCWIVFSLVWLNKFSVPTINEHATFIFKPKKFHLWSIYYM